MYAAIVGVGQVLESRRQLRERTLQAAELESALARAELQALKSQLQPHFLFNALHAVSVLIDEDPEAASRMLSRIGDLLRQSLTHMSRGTVPLHEELEFIGLYLEIEAVRFGPRLRTRIEAADEARDLPVPPFLLQPLVENAVRHGIEPEPAGGAVDVLATCDDGKLRLTVRDDGVGWRGAQPADGLGLRLTRDRLARTYGARHSFELRGRDAGGTEAIVELPLDTATSR